MGCPMKNLYLVLSGADIYSYLLFTINVNMLCHILLSYNNHGGGMGCPRIVLLHVYNCNVHRNFIMYSYLYTGAAPFGADGLINKINLFNSTVVYRKGS